MLVFPLALCQQSFCSAPAGLMQCQQTGGGLWLPPHTEVDLQNNTRHVSLNHILQECGVPHFSVTPIAY